MKEGLRKNTKYATMFLKEKKLYRKVWDKGKEKLCYVIPRSMKKNIAVKFHGFIGHFSVDRAANKIKELYWFPYMNCYLCRHTALWFECLMNKVLGGKQQAYLHPIKPVRWSFSLIHMDYLDPFVKKFWRNQDFFQQKILFNNTGQESCQRICQWIQIVW